jgi:hypothetical protein
VAALSEQLRRERADLARGSHARRFEMVSLVLDSAPVTTGRASTGLGYDLRRRHTAAVLWTDPRRPDQGALAQAAEALGPATRARQVLSEGARGPGAGTAGTGSCHWPRPGSYSRAGRTSLLPVRAGWG